MCPCHCRCEPIQWESVVCVLYDVYMKCLRVGLLQICCMMPVVFHNGCRQMCSNAPCISVVSCA